MDLTYQEKTMKHRVNIYAVFVAVHALCALAPRAAIGQAGPVLCWGYNGSGQLGDGTTANKGAPGAAYYVSGIKAVATGGGHTLALSSNGQVYAWGSNSNGQLGQGDHIDQSTPTLVPSLGDVIAIA